MTALFKTKTRYKKERSWIFVGEKALLIAKEEIMRVVQEKRPSKSYEEALETTEQILSSIDWENPALMHKDIEWIALFYLNRLVNT